MAKKDALAHCKNRPLSIALRTNDVTNFHSGKQTGPLEELVWRSNIGEHFFAVFKDYFEKRQNTQVIAEGKTCELFLGATETLVKVQRSDAERPAVNSVHTVSNIPPRDTTELRNGSD